MQTLGLAAADPHPDLTRAHRHCLRNRPEVLASDLCGCFYCMATFPPSEITNWINDGEQTAECPNCGIDAVLGSASGLPVTRPFLQRMYDRWFAL